MHVYKISQLKFIVNIALILFLTACGGGGGSDSGGTTSPPAPPANVAPTADAGTDQTVDENAAVTLAGSGSDTDGTIASYSWEQTAGTTVTLSEFDSANANFTVPDINADETLTFKLTVTDDDGATARDSVDIFTKQVNQAPTASAGEDQTVDENTMVTLAGSGSDTDGSIASYGWEQTSGTNVTLTNPNSASASFTAPDINADETLTFELTVTDDDGAKASDSVDTMIQLVDIQTALIDNQISIKLSQVGEGTITVNAEALADCVDTGTCEYFQLNSQSTEFLAAPAEGWEFVRWNNCSSQSGNTCTVNSQSNTSLQLTFKREKTELFDNVVMLDDDQIDSLINYDPLGNELTFSPSVVSDEFLVGNILIAQRITDSSDSSIYFAKRIISASEDADTNIVLSVEQANPESIVRSGTLSTELIDTSIQQLKVLNYDKYSITKSKKKSKASVLKNL
jgi:hypothetical protein